MAHNDNKYTVHARLSDLTSRVTELEAENKRLRVHLAGELKTAINDAKHVIQDSIRIPLDGKDGAPGKDSTVPGPRGDVLYIGNDELELIVARLRAEVVLQRAKFQALLLQACTDDEKASGTHRTIFRKRLENLKREFGL